MKKSANFRNTLIVLIGVLVFSFSFTFNALAQGESAEKTSSRPGDVKYLNFVVIEQGRVVSQLEVNRKYAWQPAVDIDYMSSKCQVLFAERSGLNRTSPFYLDNEGSLEEYVDCNTISAEVYWGEPEGSWFVKGVTISRFEDDQYGDWYNVLSTDGTYTAGDW